MMSIFYYEIATVRDVDPESLADVVSALAPSAVISIWHCTPSLSHFEWHIEFPTLTVSGK
jgi:hypothetical protein